MKGGTVQYFIPPANYYSVAVCRQNSQTTRHNLVANEKTRLLTSGVFSSVRLFKVFSDVKRHSDCIIALNLQGLTHKRSTSKRQPLCVAATETASVHFCRLRIPAGASNIHNHSSICCFLPMPFHFY